MSSKLSEEPIDLQTLIKPLPVFGSLELAELQNTTGKHWHAQTEDRLAVDVDTLDLAQFMAITQSQIGQQADDFVKSLDKQQEDLNEQRSLTQTIIGSSVGISSGLSVGYLIWLIRGGTLMGSVLSSLPAWRFVDPLPVLSSLVNDIDGDDDSLASMVNADGEEAENPLAKNQSTSDTSIETFNGAKG